MARIDVISNYNGKIMQHNPSALQPYQRVHTNTIGFTVLVFICGHVFGCALMVWMVMRAISLDDLVRIGSSGISESALQALAQARALYPIALGMCAVALVAACVAAARHQVTRRST